MIKIEWSGFDWDDIEKSLLEEIANNLQLRLQSVYCEEHKQFAKVTLAASSLETIEFEISACCEDLLARTQSALN